MAEPKMSLMRSLFGERCHTCGARGRELPMGVLERGVWRYVWEGGRRRGVVSGEGGEGWRQVGGQEEERGIGIEGRKGSWEGKGRTGC